MVACSSSHPGSRTFSLGRSDACDASFLGLSTGVLPCSFPYASACRRGKDLRPSSPPQIRHVSQIRFHVEFCRSGSTCATRAAVAHTCTRPCFAAVRWKHAEESTKWDGDASGVVGMGSNQPPDQEQVQRTAATRFCVAQQLQAVQHERCTAGRWDASWIHPLLLRQVQDPPERRGRLALDRPVRNRRLRMHPLAWVQLGGHTKHPQ